AKSECSRPSDSASARISSPTNAASASSSGASNSTGRRPAPGAGHQPRDVRVIALEVQDVADVGAAECVDALVVVPHHGQVPVPVGEQPQQLVLDAVGVLVLVHQYVIEARSPLGQHPLV